MSEKPERTSHKLDLDLSKREDAHVEDLIDQLKTDRKFSQTIKDGIRLIVDLREGRFEVLFQLFPLIKGDLLEYMANQEILIGMTRMNRTEEKLPSRSTIVDEQQRLEEQRREYERRLAEERREIERKNAEEQQRLEEQRREYERRLAEERRELDRMMDKLAQERQLLQQEREEQQNAVTSKLARIEEWIQEQALSPSTHLHTSHSQETNQQGNARQLPVPEFSAPSFDDDEDDDNLLDIRVDESAGKRATQNFLASLQALIDDD